MASPRSTKRSREEVQIENSQSYAAFDLKAPLHIEPFLDSQSQSGDTQPSYCDAPSEVLNTQFPHNPKSNHDGPRSPARSTTGSLTDPGTSTPIPGSPSIAALNGLGPAAKRQKLTFAENEVRQALKQVRDSEKAEERTKREMEKREKEQEKARREAEKEAEKRKKDAEREQKRILKEAEDAEKEAEKKKRDTEREKKRLLKEAENAEKEKLRKAKEEEKQRAEDEKRKKEKSQPKLNAFFVKKPAQESPIKPSAEASITVSVSPLKMKDMSIYERLFPPFFLQNNVRLAPIKRFQRENYGSNNLVEELDSYITNNSSFQATPFDAADLFNCPDLCLYTRGKHITPVREIMKQHLGGAGRPIDLTTDSQNIQIKNTRRLLSTVPYKVIAFKEDVRPPYNGTHTSQSSARLRKLARNSTKPELPELNYDYDSEAEWVDEVEDGEDLDSEDGEEDDEDGAEDLGEFLDDADDVLAQSKKLAVQGDLEPKCTGLCWEDEKGRGRVLSTYGYRMEIMHENISIKTPIDPFATHYWEPPVPAVIQALMNPPRIPLNAMKGTSSAVNGPNKQVRTIGSEMTKPSNSLAPASNKKQIHPDDMDAFREHVQGNDSTKLLIQETLHKLLKKSTKEGIKNTLDLLARRAGPPKNKRWELIDSTPQEKTQPILMPSMPSMPMPQHDVMTDDFRNCDENPELRGGPFHEDPKGRGYCSLTCGGGCKYTRWGLPCYPTKGFETSPRKSAGPL